MEIVVDTGDGAQTYEVTATRAGRRVEVSTGRGMVEVNEVTRTGTLVRTARFMASRVIALVEHPVDTTGAGLARRCRQAVRRGAVDYHAAGGPSRSDGPAVRVGIAHRDRGASRAPGPDRRAGSRAVDGRAPVGAVRP